MARRFLNRCQSQISRLSTTVVSLPMPPGSPGRGLFQDSQLADLIVQDLEHGPEDFQAGHDPARQVLRSRSSLPLPPVRRRGQPWLISSQRPWASSFWRDAPVARAAGGGGAAVLPPRWGRGSRPVPACCPPVAREPLAKHGGIARVGLHPRALLVQLARGNHVAARPSASAAGKGQTQIRMLHRPPARCDPPGAVLPPRAQTRRRKRLAALGRR